MSALSLREELVGTARQDRATAKVREQVARLFPDFTFHSLEDGIRKTLQGEPLK